MTNQNDGNTGSGGSESIYKAPTSDTRFAPGGDSLEAYVGPKNAAYYSRVFDRFESGGSSVSWHWPAFFFASFWLLYRKMWLNAFLYWIVLPFVLTMVAMIFARISGPSAYFTSYYGLYFLAAFILMPMFANRLYFRHAQSKINKVASVTSSPDQQAVELARIGGTSNVVLVVLPIVLIAVIGILAAISIPAYQDYTVRAQVSEGLNLSSGAKAAVTEYISDRGNVPLTNEDAGLAAADSISGNYVSSVEIDSGTIIVTYGNEAHGVIRDRMLLLEPDYDPDSRLVSWTCSSPGIMPKHLPAACR